MQATRNSPSKGAIWTGRALSALAILFLLFDSLTKLMMADPVLKASVQLGYPVSLLPVTGGILLFCLIVYAIPRTSVFGALLLTGYLGGAVEANLRIGTPLFTNVLFPVYFAVVVWGGVFLRDRRVRTFFSFSPRRNNASRQQIETSVSVNRPVKRAKAIFQESTI